ncbi:MAG: DUF2232 domain-containing protein [Clostridia bacterium]|nr:DUF2232 domain-containing protein [Clostridia bacterium]
MKKESTRALREGAMMVALTAILMMLTRYMPLFSMAGVFVCGIPLAALAARNNLKVLLPSFVVVFVVSILIDGNIISAISMILMSCVPGAVAGYLLGRRRPFFITLCSTCMAVCIGWIFQLAVIELIIGNGIEEMFSQVMTQVEATMSELINSMGENLDESLKVSPQQFSDMLISAMETTIRLYFPSFVIISSMITGYIIIRVSGFVIKRAHLANIDSVPFSMLKAPRSMSIIAVIFYTIYIFMDNKSVLWSLIANVVMVLYTILGVCGLSVADYKLKTKIKSSVARFGIYLLIFFLGSALMNIISNVLIIVGILDAGRDFRQIGNYGRED